MKLRKKIKLYSKDNNVMVEINLKDIENIYIIEGEKIIVELKNKHSFIIHKKNLYYPHWIANLDLIRRLFEDE